MNLYLFILALSLNRISKSDAVDDLYNVLGVSRSASAHEIENAYKNLAKEWDPDNNNDPTATDKFTKINEAYETLSDKERRTNYDRFGYTSAQEQRQRGSFDDFIQGGFGPFGFSGGMEKFLTTLQHYETKLHPETFKNPCFIYAYTDLCCNCMLIEPVVFKFMSELENVGMCVVAVHLRHSPGLASHLRLYSAPSILGVVSGRITFFKRGAISFDDFRDFLKSLFPSDTLTQVNDGTFQNFLEGWRDNKVRAIFFSSKPEPSIRFLAPAFYFRDRITCGFVHTADPNADKLLTQLNVNKYRETLILWNEITNSTLATIVMQQLSRSTIDEVLSTHRYLALPRLSSQTVFDDLCPQGMNIKKKRLCVALVTKKAEEHSVAMHTFREFAQTSTIPNNRVKFVYIYEDVQHNFIKALTKGNETHSRVLVEIVIIWRQEKQKLNYEFLEHGWSLDPQAVPHSRRQLEERLTQILNGDNLLPYKATVPEFYDEHMLGLFTRILFKLYDWYDRIYMYCTSYDEMTLLMAVAALVFIITIAFSMKKLAAAKAEEMRKKQLTKNAEQRPPSCDHDKETDNRDESARRRSPVPGTSQENDQQKSISNADAHSVIQTIAFLEDKLSNIQDAVVEMHQELVRISRELDASIDQPPSHSSDSYHSTDNETSSSTGTSSSTVTTRAGPSGVKKRKRSDSCDYVIERKGRTKTEQSKKKPRKVYTGSRRAPLKKGPQKPKSKQLKKSRVKKRTLEKKEEPKSAHYSLRRR